VARPRTPLVILSFGGKEVRIGGETEPAWQYETVYESVQMIPLAQGNRFGERSALERPPGLVPSRQLCEFAGLWLGLPTWSAIDGSGRIASFYLSVPGIGNSASSLLVRKDIVSAYMKQTKSCMLWVVSGERQRLSRSGMNAAYKKYLQVFALGRRGIQKLHEVRDRATDSIA
jgi:hypothetical protein